jgi:16S rRNA (guanine527-N7)-methyltransferase
MPAHVDLPNEKIISCLQEYGFSPDLQTCDRIRAYIALLLRWNQRIALTAVTDPLAILKFHFGESVYGIAAGVAGGGRLADVGSGAGFPGIPLHQPKPRLRLQLN